MNRELSSALMALGCLLLLGALGVGGWQLVQFLREGQWPSLPLTYVLATMTDAPYDSWLSYPQEWKGVHKVLGWFSLGGALVVAGFASVWAGAALER